MVTLPLLLKPAIIAFPPPENIRPYPFRLTAGPPFPGPSMVRVWPVATVQVLFDATTIFAPLTWMVGSPPLVPTVRLFNQVWPFPEVIRFTAKALVPASVPAEK